jgi:hypothetical protein
MRAAEIQTLVQSPSGVKYRKEPSAPVKCDFSNERLQYCVDISVLVERCDRSGFLAAFLSGMRWEAIPDKKQGQVAADIRKFRRELRHGGYEID